MNNKSYFERVAEKFEKLTDEEFFSLLIESGLEDCPYEVTFNVPVTIKKKIKYEYRVDPVEINPNSKKVA